MSLRSKPKSPAQIEASRRNGAKSRGPITQNGKSISSRNRTTHGLLSRAVAIHGEDPARFANLLASLRATLQPANSLEETLVEDLAICHWRRRRLQTMETACYTSAIQRRHAQPDSPNSSQPADPNLATNAGRAVEALATTDRTLDLITRFEFRYARQFARTLNQFRALHGPKIADLTKILENEHTNPITD